MSQTHCLTGSLPIWSTFHTCLRSTVWLVLYLFEALSTHVTHPLSGPLPVWSTFNTCHTPTVWSPTCLKHFQHMSQTHCLVPYLFEALSTYVTNPLSGPLPVWSTFHTCHKPTVWTLHVSFCDFSSWTETAFCSHSPQPGKIKQCHSPVYAVLAAILLFNQSSQQDFSQRPTHLSFGHPILILDPFWTPQNF